RLTFKEVGHHQRQWIENTQSQEEHVPQVMPQPCPIMSATEWTSGTILVMDTGYARVSTAKQDVNRQIDALCQEGIARNSIYVDKKSGSTTDRPGLHKALDQARERESIVAQPPDRPE